MKKLLVVLVVLTVCFAACYKGNDTDCVPEDVQIKAPDPEINALRGYLAGNGITATEDPRGFFYTLAAPGTGVKPNTCSFVNLDYVAKLTNGATVDSNKDNTYQVRAFIIGWQEALPLMAAGGKMTLYLPPSLAYGSTANGNVPANSNMIFNIDLHVVQ